MNPSDRLLQVVGELQKAGIRPLVMGGHAVRHYGVDRNTLDFDFTISLEAAAGLESGLRSTALFADNRIEEGPSWRPQDFRRFQIGRLQDGRQEWIEFWLRNHLLAPFEQLWSRREEAATGPLVVAYLSLPDLIRSKETERDSDWQDVALLEETLDLRGLNGARDEASMTATLSGLRSRRGFERAQVGGFFEDRERTCAAWAQAGCMITRAILMPLTRGCLTPPRPEPPGWNLLENPLRHVKPGSARHLALIEAARRLHRQAAMTADRADKERRSR
ncbi:MAG: hypothetical protein HYY18_22255 [Planctomycetes bacterium]|nr:hypothetical protein [Planctomycetota bacterium]